MTNRNGNEEDIIDPAVDTIDVDRFSADIVAESETPNGFWYLITVSLESPNDFLF